MGRIIAAALAGGLIVFLWGAFAHIATPLGTAGFSTMHDEGSAIEALSRSVDHSGLYMFPAEGMTDKSEASQKAWQEKLRRGPSGLLLYTAGGTEPLSMRQLVVEFISVVLAALVAAILVSMVAAPYFRRVLVVVGLALFAFFSLSLSYWNWFGFPTVYIGAELLTEGIGWFLAGLAIARIAPRGRAVVAV
jgi:hypothetical protein